MEIDVLCSKLDCEDNDKMKETIKNVKYFDLLNIEGSESEEYIEKGLINDLEEILGSYNDIDIKSKSLIIYGKIVQDNYPNYDYDFELIHNVISKVVVKLEEDILVVQELVELVRKFYDLIDVSKESLKEVVETFTSMVYTEREKFNKEIGNSLTLLLTDIAEEYPSMIKDLYILEENKIQSASKDINQTIMYFEIIGKLYDVSEISEDNDIYRAIVDNYIDLIVETPFEPNNYIRSKVYDYYPESFHKDLNSAVVAEGLVE